MRRSLVCVCVVLTISFSFIPMPIRWPALVSSTPFRTRLWVWLQYHSNTSYCEQKTRPWRNEKCTLRPHMRTQKVKQGWEKNKRTRMELNNRIVKKCKSENPCGALQPSTVRMRSAEMGEQTARTLLEESGTSRDSGEETSSEQR